MKQLKSLHLISRIDNCAENVLMAMQYGTWKRGRISPQPLEQTGIGLRGVITGRIIAINVEVPG